MDDDEEHRYYGDSTILEPIVEQQDDEMTTSPMSSSSIDTSFLEEEQRAHEEIQQFEELEKEFASNKRGVRVKFDDERLSPSTKTTLIKTEPYFQVNSTEDQVTKHFYHNEFQSKDEDNNQLSKQSSSKTPSEQDSLEQEYIGAIKEEKDSLLNPNEFDQKKYHKNIDLSDQISLTSPSKSILKKCQQKEKKSISKLNQSLNSRSCSPSSLNKKHTSSTCFDSNEIQHLAEVTGKETSSQPFPPLRSLFEPTINIFDSSNSNQLMSNTCRPARLRYYVKPYRGDTYIPPNINKQRSRSLSEQRFAQKSRPTVWYTFSNQYNRPSYGQLNRRQHVSWSPVRQYIHQGRDKTVKSPTKKMESLSNKTSSLLSTHSASNPCLRSCSSMIPVSVRYRSSRLSEIPQHFRQSFPPLSIDSYESSSITNCSLTPMTPSSQHSQYEQKKDKIFGSSLPDIVHQHKKEHDDTIQRYDRLLEKMRETDEQLQTLSRSWTNTKQQKISVCKNNLFY
ncbi:unnamed protein product [Rotaria sp. Silwood2]|nr:unnamed protein product [Rotaria sp. Silwood2]CAF2791032.1 unnamed protein product [Rotaria sp. Silwood2]CAF2914285.1 unnamed protein product [Rotaria sp. Silwood2]CAF3363736.1 unnamed protein product [Rotaria sp. Silwood2]